jgi:signal transduction histidine kinase
LRGAAFVLFAINTAFIGVDFVVYPEMVRSFLPVRLGLDVLLLGIYFGTARPFPVASSFATSAAGAWMLFTVVHGTGGATSDYYVGLVLLLIGIGVLAPLSTRQGASMIGAIFVGYVALSLAGEGPDDWKRFALSIFFLGAAAFVGAMSCAYLDRMRFADFLQRRELERARRARDELEQLDAAKSRFTANIHHELRTPLTLTLAPVETMLAGGFGEITEQQRSYLETIRSNGLRLLKLINNLLDLAKIESRQLSVTRRALHVGDLAAELVAGSRPLAERKGVTLEARGLEALPQIHADPEALEKVIVNLLGNALKFTESGGRIDLEGRAADAGGVELVVRDTGLGIPADQLDRIFDRFAQVDGSTTRRHEGTGIGLALTRELVALHGGRIWAESAGIGRGAEMHVLLPRGEPDESGDELSDAVLATADGAPEALSRSLAAMEAELDLSAAEGGSGRLVELERSAARAEGVAAADEEAAAPAPSVAADAPEVLIVEDNPDMRRLLSFLIGQEFRLRVARNGREGLERVRERHPDLVLTDVMMPEMSGTELCAALKADRATEGIPVVLVTSKAEREMKIEGLEGGADDYVTKPFHPRELLARVRSLVRLRMLGEELAERNALLESTNEELQVAMQELKEAGAQLVHAERLAAVGELAAGVAHEVNNPVNFAVNAVHTLCAQVEDVRRVVDAVKAIDERRPDQLGARMEAFLALRERVGFDELVDSLAELASIVTQGLDRTAELVGDLRDFAGPDGRRRAHVDVCRGLRSTLRLMGHGLAEAGIRVENGLPDALPTVEGEPRALNQVFLNLLKNAAEALEGRRGTIRVTARALEGSVLVEIRDDGSGVSPEIRERLFEPFFTTREDGGGTGLGLSICRRIVREHGGEIEIGPGAEGGTRVSVRLPTRRPAERAALQEGDGATPA